MNPRRLLEVQIHAPDIRRGVRYLFLDRRHFWVTGGAAALVLAFVAWGFSRAPGVARNQLSRQQYRELERVRVQQGERLKSLLGRLEQLADGAETLRLRTEKVYLAYGLPQEGARGQGGFPVVRPPVPHSIYADSIAHGGLLQTEVVEQLEVVSSFLRDVQEFEQAHADEVTLTPSICPLTGRDFVLTSPFGMRRNPFTKSADFHAGLDLAAPPGTPVHATASGVVVFAGRYDLRQSVGWWRYGNLVMVRHGDRFATLYGHCQDVQVRVGQRVEQGQTIATVGNTGWSTSPHLHYEVRRRDAGDYRPIDPRIYILDHRWRDEERLLVRARSAPDPGDYEPLPRSFGPVGR
ncbi:MAG TPA: M23 family metallopeptidase [Thermoanaerobaculia bacterium]|nr:M23 family metallopeptidase [Thermoanaerobaculia bacterium]